MFFSVKSRESLVSNGLKSPASVLLVICLLAVVFGCSSYADDAFLVDVRNGGFDQTLMYTSIQGLANREKPVVFLRFTNLDSIWAGYYAKQYGFKFQQVTDPVVLVGKLRSDFHGYLVWDPLTMCTANVATTLSGLYDLLIVSPNYEYVALKAGLEKKFDLRGKFDGLSDEEVYRWCAQKFLGHCSRTVTGNLVLPNELDFSILPLVERDRTVMLKFEDSKKADGNGAKLKGVFIVTPSETLRIVPGSKKEAQYLVGPNDSWIDKDGYRVADMNQSFTYRLSFPRPGKSLRAKIFVDNQYKLTAYSPAGGESLVMISPEIGKPVCNQIRDYLIDKKAFVMDLASNPGERESFDLKGDILGKMKPGAMVLGWTSRNESEGRFVSLTSSKGLTVLCSQNSPNFSFHSKIKSTVKRTPLDRKEPKLEKGKVYVSFIASDGDALHRLSDFHRSQWLLSQRGKIPMGWEMQPLLRDLAPGMLGYYLGSASKNDDFVASSSGIGYFYPSLMPRDQLRSILKVTASYLESVSCATLFVASTEPMPDSLKELYRSVFKGKSSGCIEGYQRSEEEVKYFPDFAWVPTTLPPSWMKSPDDFVSGLEMISQSALQGEAEFVVVHFDFNYLSYAQVLDIVARLDRNLYVIVNPTTLMKLAQKYYKEKRVMMPSSPAAIDGLTTLIPFSIQNTSTQQQRVVVLGGGGKVDSVDATFGPGTTYKGNLVVKGNTGNARMEIRSQKDTAKFPLSFEVIKPAIPLSGKAVFTRTFEAELLSHSGGALVADSDAVNGFAWSSGKNAGGPSYIVYGPYEMRDAGDYVVFFRVRLVQAGNPPSLTLEVSSISDLEGGQMRLLASQTIDRNKLIVGQYVDLPLEFHNPGDWRLEYRVLCGSGGPLNVDRIYLFKT